MVNVSNIPILDVSENAIKQSTNATNGASMLRETACFGFGDDCVFCDWLWHEIKMNLA
jgi:hypothetical protein